ncbi:MAG: glycosyltransferase family 2 protein [Spirochaetia bacterium]|nr:glycosyltransferase family 2 protein [Spirochaetia bacterium]
MSATKTLVTIMTPVYNALPYLPDYLECLKKQTWRPLECIFVDDGSIDGSAQLLQKEKSAMEETGLTVKLVFKEHGGQASAINSALPLVTGELITWCDDDDLLTPDSIEKKAQWLIDHPDYGMVRSDSTIYDMDKKCKIGKASDQGSSAENLFDDILLDRTYCFAGCYMIRTELLFSCYPDKRIPESPEGQNLQLLLPPASRTACGHIPEELHTYRRHSKSHSRQGRSFKECMERIKNFTALRLAILDHCQCDREKYKKIAAGIEQSSIKELLCQVAHKTRFS